MTVEILGRESSGASEIYPNVLVSITSLSGIILNRFFHELQNVSESTGYWRGQTMPIWKKKKEPA